MTSNEMALMANIAVDMQKNEVNAVLDKIRAEIAQLQDGWFKETEGWWCYEKALQIIDKYTNVGMSPEVKEHYEQLAEHYNRKAGLKNE